MKYMNKTLLFGACLLGAAALPAQVLVDDFEATTHTWATESCYSDIRENEYKTGLNLSDKVLYAQRSPGCNNWSGAIFTPATPYTGYNYLHVLMYRNNTAQPNLKVSDEHPTGGTLDLTPMTTIRANEWQDVVFDISAFATAGVDFIIRDEGDDAYGIEIPAINCVYIHMLGSDCHNILTSKEHISAFAEELKDFDYDLVLTSHYVPEGQESVEAKIAYLEKTLELADTCADTASFIEAMNEAFPDYSGANYLETTAGMLYQ